eukprot:gene10993-12804_t
MSQPPKLPAHGAPATAGAQQPSAPQQQYPPQQGFQQQPYPPQQQQHHHIHNNNINNHTLHNNNTNSQWLYQQPPPQQYQQPYPPQQQVGYPPVAVAPGAHGVVAAAPGSTFVAPPGSRFTTAPLSQVNIRIIGARNLVAADISGKSDPYVKIRMTSTSKYHNTKVVQKNLNPTWNETFQIELINSAYDLIVLEVYDKDSIGSDDLIGYVALDPSLFPKATEVVTWEKLSYVSHGELNIGVTAINFGLEGVPANYPVNYINWRQSIPPTSKKGMEKAKKKDKHGKKDKAAKHGAAAKKPGPYGSKAPPTGYTITNGWVKKNPSLSDQASKTLGKGGRNQFNLEPEQ